MYLYNAYGANISSYLPISDLLIQEDPDVDISISKSPSPLESHIDPAKTYQSDITDNGIYLHWPEIGTFCIDKLGERILVDTALEIDPDYIKLAITGPVLAIAMHLRGNLVLHASGVLINDKVCLFVGPSGAGKSTMLASMLSRGHKLICDDVAVIRLEGKSSLTLFPGIPRIKLWPDSAESVNYSGDEIRHLYEGYEKLSVSCTQDDVVKSSFDRIDQIFCLGVNETVEIRTPTPREGLLALISNCYVGMMDKDIAKLRAAEEFKMCSNLAEQTKISVLSRPQNLDLLPDICALVEREAGCI